MRSARRTSYYIVGEKPNKSTERNAPRNHLSPLHVKHLHTLLGFCPLRQCSFGLKGTRVCKVKVELTPTLGRIQSSLPESHDRIAAANLRNDQSPL